MIDISQKHDTKLKNNTDIFVPLNSNDSVTQVLSATVILKLLAYHTSKELVCEIDKPRNLAKSVMEE